MKNNIKISVIMGVYNPASQERLFRSVQSVIDQSFAEWELLLYDDGSQAPFTSLIQAAAALDPRILLLHGQQNRGLAHALNVCIRSASGSYITISVGGFPCGIGGFPRRLGHRIRSRIPTKQGFPLEFPVYSSLRPVSGRGVARTRRIRSIPLCASVRGL